MKLDTQFGNPQNGARYNYVFSDCTSSFAGSGDMVVSGSGAGSGQSATAAESGHPGIRRMSTGTTAVGQAHIGNGLLALLLGEGEWNFESLWRLQQLSSAGQRFTQYCGFYDTVTANPTNAFVVDYTDNQASGAFVLKSIIGGATTSVVLPTLAAAGTWYKWSFRLSPSGLLSLALNDVAYDLDALGASGLALPTAALAVGVNIRKTIGITAMTYDIDYIGYSWTTVRS